MIRLEALKIAIWLFIGILFQLNTWRIVRKNVGYLNALDLIGPLGAIALGPFGIFMNLAVIAIYYDGKFFKVKK